MGVRVATINGDAIGGRHYQSFNDIINFNYGEPEKYVTLFINDDNIQEPDRDLFVQLFDY